jgi:CubicO group peptidase (beta-lactamase class C family)
MKRKALLLVCNLILLSSFVFAQSPVERRNRTVYNRIEYFINSKQPDSVYTLASDDFKRQVDQQGFVSMIRDLANYGKISNTEPASFSNNIAGYNFMLGAIKSSLYLGVDSNYKFNYFLLQQGHIPITRMEAVASNVNKQNALDHYIDSVANAYLANPNTKSLAIGVINKGKINTFFYGQTDAAVKASLPDGNTLYEIGSVTKVFTATLLADLVEKGTIALDDSIVKFLPDSLAQNPFLQKITFKHLANHTSGLPRLPDNLEKAAKFNPKNPYATYSRKDLFHYLKNVSSENEPGENFEYSNLGYGLLGELISIVTNKTYAQNIKEIISDSLKLPNTVDKANLKTQKIVKVYNEQGQETPIWDFQAFAGTGALKSSVHDLLRFAQYQFKLPETTLENAMALTRQFTFYLPPNTDIGLAWHMNMVDDVIQYWHNGGTGGSSSFIGLVPDKKSAIVVLSNSAISVDEISGMILSKIASSK